MKTIFEWGGRNPFAGAKVPLLVTVEQSENWEHLFRVTYGLQRKPDLTYNQACAEIGSAILHALCCDGIASNQGA